MTNNQVVKNVLTHSRDVFENTYKALNVVFERNQKLAEQVMENAAYLPKEVKEINQKWLNAGKEARQNFYETVVNGHKQMEEFVTTPQ
jgi:hypothetical protein